MYASKDDLLAVQAETRDHTLSTGHVVKIRGLTVAEARAISGESVQATTIAAGLVEPAMTVEEVERWIERAPAGDVIGLLMAIQGLSGMLEGAAKEAYKSFRGQSSD